MPGIPFVRFVDVDYYMCKQCKTHIALASDFTSTFFMDQLSGRASGLFMKAVNVRPVDHNQIGYDIIANIKCLKCDERLGIKYIQAGLQTDMVTLVMHCLLKKQGDQILYADTRLPVPEIANGIHDPEEESGEESEEDSDETEESSEEDSDETEESSEED